MISGLNLAEMPSANLGVRLNRIRLKGPTHLAPELCPCVVPHTEAAEKSFWVGSPSLSLNQGLLSWLTEGSISELLRLYYAKPLCILMSNAPEYRVTLHGEYAQLSSTDK